MTRTQVAAQRGRMVAGLSAVAMVVLAGIVSLDAQQPWTFWNTSADAPPGLAADAFSAPDGVDLVDGDDNPAPPAFVPGPATWRGVGSALKPRNAGVTTATSGSGGCGYVSAGDTFTVWHAVPELPDGAVVSTLRMFYNDTSASNSTAWLTAYDLYGNIAQEWSVSSTGNLGNSFSDSAPINHTINYATNSYLLNWRPNVVGSTMQLCGFRLFFTVPLVVPGAPVGLVGAVAGRTVTLSWSAPVTGGPTTGYILEAGSGPGLANLVTQPVAGTVFAAGNVPSGTYYIRVRATNGAGASAPTADVVVVVP